jgi:HEAT repeat protein
LERRINRVIRSNQGRVIRSAETGGYALPEAFEPTKNTVFLLKPMYPSEENSDLIRRFDDEMKYVQRIFRQASNHPAGVQIDSYDLPFSQEEKQQALTRLLDSETGEERPITELEVACDDEAPYLNRWLIRDQLVNAKNLSPLVVEKTVRLLESDIVALRLLAVEILGYIGDALVVPALLKCLREDSHPDVRGFASLSLGRLQVFEARLPIANRALQAPDTGERHDHLSGLALLGGLGDTAPGIHLESEDPTDPTTDLRNMINISTSEGLPGITARLLDTNTPRGERLACISLIEITTPEDSLAILYSLFDDIDEHIRSSAMLVTAVHLLQIEELETGGEEMEHFANILNVERSARCRETAATILGKIGDKSVIPLVDRRGLGDPDFLVRDAAERSLRTIEDRLFGHHRVRSDADLGIWRR